MYSARLGSSTVTVATPTAEPAGQLLPSLFSATKSSCEHCCAAVTLPSRPGGSWKLRFLASSGRGGLEDRRLAGFLYFFEGLVEVDGAGQLERVRTGLGVGRAAFVFRRDR